MNQPANHFHNLQLRRSYSFQHPDRPGRILPRAFSGTYHVTFLILVLFVSLSAQGCSVLAFSELKGHYFRGCTLIESPYVLSHPETRTGFNGIALTYLDRLRENLQFSFHIEMWNGTWRQLVDHFANCSSEDPSSPDYCQCDIGMSSFTMTSERVEKVNFVSAFAHEDYQMIARIPQVRKDDSHSVWFLLQPFSTRTWLLILTCLFLYAMGIPIFHTFCGPEAKEGSHADDDTFLRLQEGDFLETAALYFSRLPAASFMSYLRFIGHPLYEPSQRTPSVHRTAYFLLGLTAGCFLLILYSASLVVLLFAAQHGTTFDIIADIQACKIAPERIAMIWDGAAQYYWNNVINTTEARRKCNWDRAGIPVSSLRDGIKLLMDGQVDYFYGLQGSVLFAEHRTCNQFTCVGEPFFSTAVGFIMPRRTNMTVLDMLSRETRRLREADEYPSARRLALRRVCEAPAKPPLTLKRLRVFFFIVACAGFLLVVYKMLLVWRSAREKRNGTAGQYTGRVVD